MKRLKQSKPTPGVTPQPYTQGRYRCALCGEFDLITLGIVACADYTRCPTCHYDALLVGMAKCCGLDPQPGFNVPGSMERRLGYLNKETRGTRTVIGHGRRRVTEDCVPCDAETFSHTGARDRADEMQVQHQRSYRVFPCPFSEGYHVTPMEG